jgi:hypothetical protein
MGTSGVVGCVVRSTTIAVQSLLILAAGSLAFAQYQVREWASFEDQKLPPKRILFGVAPTQSISVLDLTKVSPQPLALTSAESTSEIGNYAMMMKAYGLDGQTKAWTSAIAIGDVLDRNNLTPNSRALFQADFFFPADGPLPNLAVLAIEPPPDVAPGQPQTGGAKIKKFYRFGIAVNERLYFSLVNPASATGTADLYFHDLELMQQIPRSSWHRFAIVCQGPDLLRCYVDGREASFSPIKDTSLQKVVVGAMLADRNKSYDAYVDNLSIQLSDVAPDLPASPFDGGWPIAAGPSKRAIQAGVDVARKAPSQVSPVRDDIAWRQPVDAWTKARRENTPLFLYFFAPGLDRNGPIETAFSANPSARSFLNQHVCARVDVNQLQGGAVAQQYGIFKVPTLMVIAPDAKTYKKAIPRVSDSWENLEQQLAN